MTSLALEKITRSSAVNSRRYRPAFGTEAMRLLLGDLAIIAVQAHLGTIARIRTTFGALEVVAQSTTRGRRRVRHREAFADGRVKL